MLNKKFSVYALCMSSIYCVFVCIQNIFEMKSIGSAAFSIMGGGTLVSWITFVIMDVSTELYGKKFSVHLYSFAAILNLVIIALANIIICLPGTYPQQNEAFALMFSNGFRSILASFIAFWVGNYINVAIMCRFKQVDKKGTKKSFYVRAVVSTIFGQFVDNAIFLVIAFAPLGISLFEMTWGGIGQIILCGTLIEIGVEALLIPVITQPVCDYIKIKEKQNEN